MKRFMIVIEGVPGSYSAFSPEVPGCISTGRTREEVRRNMSEAIQFHLEGMEEDGLPLPKTVPFMIDKVLV